MLKLWEKDVAYVQLQGLVEAALDCQTVAFYLDNSS